MNLASLTLVAASVLLSACAPRTEGPAEPAELSTKPAEGVAEKLAVSFTKDQLRVALTHSPIPPVPASPTNAWGDDPRAAHFGRWLFFDKRLSHDASISCATCHDPALGFADGKQLGHGFEELRRHSPSVVNVAYHRWFYWDGRRDTLWSQGVVPIESPKEMGFDRMRLVRLLAGDDELRDAYEELFGPLPDMSDTRRFPEYARPIPKEEDHTHGVAEGVSPNDIPEHDHSNDPMQRAWDRMTDDDRDVVSRVLANVGKSLAAYQRQLVSEPAPFDTFVSGLRDGDPQKLAALDAEAQAGLALFVGRARCTLCHSGPMFTDLEFHNALVPLDPELGEDAGRFGGIAQASDHEFTATGRYSDAPDAPDADKIDFLTDPSGRPPHDAFAQFKTPSLRGVTKTAPYMHNGVLATLDDVLEHYASHADAPPKRGHVERFFVPVELTDDERTALAAFLESLDAPLVDASLGEQPSSPRW